MTDFKVESLKPLCEDFGLTLSAEAADRLNTYGNLLLEKNKVMNLTAITEPEEVLYKHFFDCLLFFSAVDVPFCAKVIDVGTGAGFPGLVLKIARPDIDITLLDSLGKRVNFLNEVLSSLSLDGKAIHLRAEEGGRKPELREQFDISCARAVASLNVLAEYCVPYTKVGGLFVAMKGGETQAEVSAGAGALSKLGCGAPQIKPAKLPQGDKRSFIIAKKISQTSTKYPRNSAKIAKAALT